MTLGKEEPPLHYAKAVAAVLRGNRVRVETKFGTDPIKASIANSEQARIHTLGVSAPPPRGPRRGKRLPLCSGRISGRR